MDKKKPEWVLFSETDTTEVTDLMNIYKESPKEARIIFCLKKTAASITRVVLFKQGNDFQLAVLRKTYGISKTNKMYHREINLGSISYSKGLFYLIKRSGSKKHIEQLTKIGLFNFFFEVIPNELGPNERREIKNDPAYLYLIERFSWIRFLGENFLLEGLPFNTIIRHKLYSRDKALRHLFKVPMPAIKVWMDVFQTYERPRVFKMWGEVRKVLYNIENLRHEMVSNELFIDTCKMGGILGQRVNCSWSLKRLKSEHDKWAREITQVMLKYEKFRELKISRVFLDFEAFSGYKLLRTNHEMIAEGIMQNHCVGTYSDLVDRGNCAIYHIQGYTLQLTYGKHYYKRKDNNSEGLDNAQFRGIGNKQAPTELTDAVNKKIVEFNESVNVDYALPEKEFDWWDI